jgi:hypothetical protein
MTATKIIADSWMEQIEVQARIKDTANWEDEWISVFERRDSYVDHFLGFLLPVSSQRADKTLKDLSWDRDFHYSGGQIAKVRLKHTNYLGLRFRRFLELEFGTNGYFQNGILIARREFRDGDIQKTDTIFVRREAVLSFVHGTKQALLWCIRSQRYSERQLEELGLELKAEQFRQNCCRYDFERMNLNGGLKIERPRMSTMTQVFGKGIVRLT